MARRAATNGHVVRTRTSELLRIATAGSVDDGKSTLIGRLLYDTKSIFEDQLEHVAADLRAPRRRLPQPRAAHRRPARRARAGHHDRRRLPLLRDAAAQVHHRRHARATSSTRATWSPAPRPPTSSIVLVDARKGVSEQTRRHAFIASLLRIPHLVVCVNKMDLVGYDEDVFDDDPRRDRPTGRRGSTCRTSRSSRSRRCTATTSSTARGRCRGTAARRCSTTSSTS